MNRIRQNPVVNYCEDMHELVEEARAMSLARAAPAASSVAVPAVPPPSLVDSWDAAATRVGVRAAALAT